MNNNDIKKQAQAFKRAQGAILTLFAFTVVNILAFAFEMNFSFLFSATIPELLGVFIAPVWGLLAALVYLGLWFWTKKWSGAVMITLIIFSIDALILLGASLLLGLFGELVFNIVFAVLILHSLITGTIAWSKLSNVDASEILAVQAEIARDLDAEVNETLDSFQTVSELDVTEFNFEAENVNATKDE